MNSALNRLNIIIMYAITVLIVLALCANIPLYLWHQPQPYIGIHNVEPIAYGRPSYPSQYAHIYMHTSSHTPSLLLKFDLDLDVRSCMTWGMRQIMVWVMVEYTTTSPARTTNTIFNTNQVVIWDTIVPFDSINDEGNLLIENIEASYPISELGGVIDFDKPMKFVVQWEITPILGLFTVYEGKYTMKTIKVDKPGSGIKVKK